MEFVSRAEWGARYGDGSPLTGPLGEVIIHTEDGPDRPDAWTTAQFAAAVRAIEAFHAGPSRGWDGIAYSFLFADNGDIFEGRGWLQRGAHTEGRNSVAHGFCFLGDGDTKDATPAQWASARWLIGEGIRRGAITPNPRISGHRDYSTKRCPGDRIYPYLGRLRGITGPISLEGDMLDADDKVYLGREFQTVVDLLDYIINGRGGVRHRQPTRGAEEPNNVSLDTLRRALVGGANPPDGDPSIRQRLVDLAGGDPGGPAPIISDAQLDRVLGPLLDARLEPLAKLVSARLQLDGFPSLSGTVDLAPRPS